MKTHDHEVKVSDLHEFLTYEAISGVLRWKAHPEKRKTIALKEAGRLSRLRQGRPARTRYREIAFTLPSRPGKRFYLQAHRIAWAMHYGKWPNAFIDHIDGNGLNNAISNLRLATRSDNARNQPLHRDNTSGLTGVTWHNQAKRWQAQAGSSHDNNRKSHYLGLHETLLDAAAARKSFEVRNGYHSNHGRNSQEFFA